MKIHAGSGPGLFWLVMFIAIAIIAIAGCVDSAHNQQGQETSAGTPQSEKTAVTTTAAMMITTVPTPQVTSNSTNTGNQCIMVPYSDVHTPDASGFTYYNTTVFTAESAGNYSGTMEKTEAGITTGQAKDFARKAFPQYSPDRIDIEFSNGSQNTRAWNFVLYKDNQELLLGSLYADTGDLMYYRVNNPKMTEKQGNSTSVTLDSARAIAENEIRQRNGEISLNLTDSRVQAGTYVFVYKRTIDGVPCVKDGINIGIDPGTGKVISYLKTWYVPEDAVAAQTVPAISRDAAIAVVEREAKACYPESADSLRIISADLRWMDVYNPDKYTPMPGVIPLTWDVRFDDKTIRAEEFPESQDGYVDAQNGTLLVMNYFHHR